MPSDDADAGPMSEVPGEDGHPAAMGDAGVTCDTGPVYTDIAPILGVCTGERRDAALDLRSPDAILRGGGSGPVVLPGDCQNSLLYLKTGASPPFGAKMPLGRAPLSSAARARLCAWIDAGALATSPACDDAPSEMASTGEEPVDREPPRFRGARDTEATERGCLVTWDPARDDVTPSEAMVYEVYATGEGEPFAPEPTLRSEPGATRAELPLAGGQDYDIHVLAVDAAGNRDDNDRVRTCSLD